MKKIVLGIVLAAGLVTVAHAREFRPMGYESIAMGGAGVASAKGAMAAYYNPALLGRDTSKTEIATTVGIGVREHNLADNLDSLSDARFTDVLTRVAANAPVPGANSAADQQSLINSQRILASMAGGNNGFSIMPEVAVGFQMQRIGFGMYGIADGTAIAIVDPDHLAFSVQNGASYYAYDPVADTYSAISQATYEASSLEYAVNNDLTYVQLNGLEVVEYPVSYGHPVQLGAGMLSVGGTLKLMDATTFNTHIKVDTPSGDIEDLLDNSEKDDDAVSVDAGLLFIPSGAKNLTLGLVGKYLNSPDFKTVVPGENFSIKPQFRAGLNFAANERMAFALDYDLSRNKTFIPGLDAQYLGGGFNIRPVSWFSFRVGAMKNLASSAEGTVLSTGIGFGLDWLQVDLGVQRSNRKGTLDGEAIPRYARAHISIVSRW